MSKDIDQVIVNDLRRFDFLAQNIWPKIRLLFKGSVAARCKQCVLSSKAPATVLNKWGICNFCEEFNTLKKDQGQKRWEDMYVAHQRQHLDQMLTDHQGKGRNRYDALVLFSGGKDSVYILSRV